MRLQHKNFQFLRTIDGERPVSKILTSKVFVNNIETDILVSQLFFGVKKESNNFVKGYSILEFVNDANEIQINDKIYKLSFVGAHDNESIMLKSIADPTGFVLVDKNLPDSEFASIESRIENVAPALNDAINEQPRESDNQTKSSSDNIGAGAIVLYTNADYENERDDLRDEGFVEYQTDPKSNSRLLVNERAIPESKVGVVEFNANDFIVDYDDAQQNIVLIELQRDDFVIDFFEDYNIVFNIETKTFTCEKKSAQ